MQLLATSGPYAAAPRLPARSPQVFQPVAANHADARTTCRVRILSFQPFEASWGPVDRGYQRESAEAVYFISSWAACPVRLEDKFWMLVARSKKGNPYEVVSAH